MRGIGKGQTIQLLLVPEIVERIHTEVSAGMGASLGHRSSKQYLQDVISWLVINSMRVDSVQYNLSCEQSVANVWRKSAFHRLKESYTQLQDEHCPPESNRAVSIFRERVDFTIENSIPTSHRYSVKIEDGIRRNRYVLLLFYHYLSYFLYYFCIFILF